VIKATATGPDGKTILMIGLSYGNLDKFRAAPGDTYIKILGSETGGLPLDVLIFSGKTEADCADMLQDMIGRDTKVFTSDRLKN
jgi:hypothetical protein